MHKIVHIFVIFAFIAVEFRNTFGNENIFVSEQNNTYYVESEEKVIKYCWWSFQNGGQKIY